MNYLKRIAAALEARGVPIDHSDHEDTLRKTAEFIEGTLVGADEMVDALAVPVSNDSPKPKASKKK